MKIVIAGYGPVGEATYAALDGRMDVVIDDPWKDHIVTEVDNVDGVVVCVSTPQNEDGSCDTGNVQDILRKYGVNRLGLFGSYARGQQRPDSDIDFLVEFKKPDFDSFMELAFYLESLFGHKVDLITPAGLNKYIKPFVEQEIKWHETG